MIETYLRNHYQKRLVNYPALLLSKHISANAVTIYALIFGLLTPLFLIYSHPYFAVLALLISGYLDTLDGTVARLKEYTSAFGTSLDIICDRVVEFSVVFGLLLINPTSRAMLIVGMLGSMLICITSFLTVGIFTENNTEKGFYYSVGLMERSEAFIFFIAMILLPRYFNYLAITFIILVSWTAFFRIYQFAKQSSFS